MTDEPFFLFGHLKMPTVYPQSTILRCLRIHFFIRTSENDQTLASKYHFEMCNNPFFSLDIWKLPEFYLKAPLMMSNDLFFYLDIWKWPGFNFRASFWHFQTQFFFVWISKNGQSCPRTHFLVGTSETCQSFTSKRHLWHPMTYFFLSGYLKMARV